MTFPDAILGLYTTEEITAGADTGGAGEYIDMEPPLQTTPVSGLAAIPPAAHQLKAVPAVEPLEVIENAEVQNAQLAEPREVEGDTTEAPVIPLADEVFEVEPLGKDQLIRLAQLCIRLEENGMSEAEWRAVISDITNGRSTSRKTLNKDEAAEAIAAFAREINKRLAAKKQR